MVMGKIAIILVFTSLFVQLSSQWLFTAKEFLRELRVKDPGSLFSTKLPVTETQAKNSGWRKTDSGKCDSSKIYRGNRYRYGTEYGTMLLFDSNGDIAGMQAAVPTSVEMAEKRKYMMPIADGRYHITVYFKNPSEICSASKTKGKNNEEKFLIQIGASWRKTMNVSMDEKHLASTDWVKGKYMIFPGRFYWFNISRKMDCEKTFPIYLVYSGGKLDSFGWTFKGIFNDPKFDHPSPGLASIAFEKETFPECIKNAKKTGSTGLIYLRN